MFWFFCFVMGLGLRFEWNNTMNPKFAQCIANFLATPSQQQSVRGNPSRTKE